MTGESSVGEGGEQCRRHALLALHPCIPLSGPSSLPCCSHVARFLSTFSPTLVSLTRLSPPPRILTVCGQRLSSHHHQRQPGRLPLFPSCARCAPALRCSQGLRLRRRRGALVGLEVSGALLIDHTYHSYYCMAHKGLLERCIAGSGRRVVQGLGRKARVRNVNGGSGCRVVVGTFLRLGSIRACDIKETTERSAGRTVLG